MRKTYKLTQEGIEDLNKEMSVLIDMRPDITERIRSARELGDLSENAEYASARTEQDRCEGRIKEIDNILKNVELITKPRVSDKVLIGNKVSLKSENGKEKKYQVVGTVEADPLEGKISDESPIGLALMGKSKGDSIDIVLPSETVTYKITAIN